MKSRRNRSQASRSGSLSPSLSLTPQARSFSLPPSLPPPLPPPGTAPVNPRSAMACARAQRARAVANGRLASRGASRPRLICAPVRRRLRSAARAAEPPHSPSEAATRTATRRGSCASHREARHQSTPVTSPDAEGAGGDRALMALTNRRGPVGGTLSRAEPATSNWLVVTARLRRLATEGAAHLRGGP